ncbi:MAG: bifunctional metallophosphatase/5'-nucleotidase, partial [Clostridia bacterium]|nr:bifunctional metallophosphatase/5'-nucleotidase [Clostridia bacterium]
MKKFLLILAAIVLLSLWCGAAAEEQTLTILFTHDMHSHLDCVTGENGKFGGLTRLKTLLDQRRAARPDALVVDGGDFSMGTLYKT